MASIGNISFAIVGKFGKFLAGIVKVQDKLRTLGERMLEIGRAARNMSLGFSAAAAVMALSAGKFEKSMTDAALVASTSKAAFGNTFKFMSQKAVEFAGSTQFTKLQVADAMKFMSMAGNEAKVTIAAMPAVMQLASAAGMDLARTADVITNVMAGFGLTNAKLAKQIEKQTGAVATSTQITNKFKETLQHTNNVMTATFTGSNVSMEELGRSFKKAGSTASQYGVSIGDLSAAIGILGNAGIKAEEAGTGLRRGMNAFVKGSGKSREAIEALGLRSDDLIKHGLPAIVKQLEYAQAAFEDAGKEAEFSGLVMEGFGERAGPILKTLVGQGSDALALLLGRIDALTAAGVNYTKFLENEKLKTWAGVLAKTKGQVDNLVGALGDELLPVLRTIAGKIGAFADYLRNNLNPATKKFIALGSLAAAIGLGIAAALFMVAGVVIKVALAFVVLTAAIGTMEIAMLPILATTLIWIALIGALILAVGFFVGMWTKNIGGMRDFWLEAWEDVKDAAMWVLEMVVKAFIHAVNVIMILINSITVSITAAIMGLDLLGAAVVDTWHFVLSAIMKTMAKAVKMVTGMLSTVVEWFPDVASALGLDVEKVDKFGAALEKLLNKKSKTLDLKLEVGGEISDAMDRFKNMTDAFTMPVQDVDKVWEAFKVFPAELQDALGGSEAIDDFGHGLRGMLLTATDGLGTMVETLFGGLSTEVIDLLDGLQIKPREIEALDREPNTNGGGGDDEDPIGDARKAFADMVQKLRDDLKLLRSPFQGIAAISIDLRNEMTLLNDAWIKAELGIERFIDAENLAKEKAQERMAVELRAITDVRKIGPAFDYAANEAANMGISMAKVRGIIESTAPDEVQSAQLPDIGQFISDNLFQVIRSKMNTGSNRLSAEMQPILKLLTDTMGEGISGALSGDGLDFGKIVPALGAAMGSSLGAAGGPVGSMIATAIVGVIEKIGPVIEGAVNGIADVLESVGSTISKAIPEPRLASAAGEATSAVVSMVKALAPVAGILATVVVLAIAGLILTAFGMAVSFSVITPVLIVFGGAIATIAGATLVLTAVLLTFAAVLLAVVVAFAAVQLAAALWVGIFIGFIAELSVAFVAFIAALPVVVGAISFLAGVLSFLAGVVANVAGTIYGAISGAGAMIVQAISSIFGPILSWIMTSLATVFGFVGNFIVGTLSAFFAPLVSVIGTVASAIGTIVSAVGSVVGAIAGLVIQIFSLIAAFFGVFAVFAILGAMLPETESFKRVISIIGLSVNRVIEALEPLMDSFLFLAGVFDFLMDVLIVFADAFASAGSLGELVFQVVKLIVSGLILFAIAIAAMQNAMITFAQFMTSGELGESLIGAFIGFVDIIIAGGQAVLDAFKMIALLLPQETQDALVAAGDTLGEIDTADLGAAFSALTGDLEPLRANTGALVELFDSWQDQTMDSMRQRALDLELQEEMNKEMRESLINVPQGYKVALERWRAIDTGVGQLTGADRAVGIGDSVSPDQVGSSGGGGGNTFIFEDGSFEVSNISELYTIVRDLIADAAQNQYGNPAAAGGNR